MSGPKVIRIVSPAEMARLEAHRDKLLAELSQVVERWKSCLSELGVLTDDKVRDTLDRLKMLEQSFFPDFTKSVERTHAEMAFLRDDMEQVCIAARAKQRELRRHLEGSARTIATKLTKDGQAPSADLLRVIECAHNASEADLLNFKKIVNAVLPSLLYSSSDQQINSTNSELTKILGAGLSEVKLISTVAKSDNSLLGMKNQRLDRLMAEVETIDEPKEAAQFAERVRRVSLKESDLQQELLIDSLILDLNARCKARRETKDVLTLLERTRKELQELELESLAGIVAEIDKATTSTTSMKQAEALVAKAREQMQQESAKLFSTSKRKAILDSFAVLGYEVREGMATAWAKNGRLIVSKGKSAAMGVELGSGASVERLQVRAVALASKGSQRDNTNDSAIEQSWCSELDEIKQLLRQSGHHLEVEQALPVGKVPLKVCEPIQWVIEETADSEERPSKQKTQSKKL